MPLNQNPIKDNIDIHNINNIVYSDNVISV